MLELISAQTAADIIGITRQHVWYLVKTGKLKAYRKIDGTMAVFDKQYVLDFAATYEDGRGKKVKATS